MKTEFDQIRRQLEGDKTSGRIYTGDTKPPVKVVSTGILSLDLATKIGGFPVGRQLEIFGQESVGKSTLACYMMAQVQKTGKPCAYLDLEGTWDAEWISKCVPELDISQVLVLEPSPGQESVEWLINLLESNKFGMVVFDSVGAMLNETEINPDPNKQGKSRVGGQALLVTNMVKRARVPAYLSDCTVVYLNQARDKIGALLPTQQSPGGRALKHMSTICIHLFLSNFQKAEKKKDEEGFRVRAKITKNKAPGQELKLTQEGIWNFHRIPSIEGVVGVDLVQDLIDCSVNLGVIKQSGAWFEHELLGKLHGKQKVRELLEKDPSVHTAIKNEVFEVYRKDINYGENWLLEEVEVDED